MMRPDEALAIDEALSTVRQAMLAALDPRELGIIEARFGFDGKTRTLRSIGADQKVSVTRIRQIEAKALRKLRGWHQRRTLYDALEVLGGRLQPSSRPRTEAYNGLWPGAGPLEARGWGAKAPICLEKQAGRAPGTPSIQGEERGGTIDKARCDHGNSSMITIA